MSCTFFSSIAVTRDNAMAILNPLNLSQFLARRLSLNMVSYFFAMLTRRLMFFVLARIFLQDLRLTGR